MNTESTTPVPTPPVIFYCPYDLAIQTSRAIADSQLRRINELRAQGYTEDQIDFLMQ